MKFILTTEELWLLNNYLKSPTIDDTLQSNNINLNQEEIARTSSSLVEKSLLQVNEKSNYVLAKDVVPFSRALDFADWRVLNVVEVENSFESVSICSIKKETICVLNKVDGLFTLEYYFTVTNLNKVLAEYLNINEIADDDPMPPFILIISMKNFDDFINMYNNNQEEAINRYYKVFGTTTKQLTIIASTILDINKRSYFIVETKKDSCLYTIYRNDKINIVTCMKKTLFDEKAVLSHQSLNDFVKWIRP